VIREFMSAPLAALNGCDDERYDGIFNILTYRVLRLTFYIVLMQMHGFSIGFSTVFPFF
jgi:hypothetical protein